MTKRSEEIDALAQRESISRNAAQKRLERAKGTPDPEQKMRRLEQEVSDLRRSNKALITRLDQAEEFRDSVFHLVGAGVDDNIWPVMPHKADMPTPHVPVLFTSDFQFGEVVKSAEMDGMNKFNRSVFADRYQHMIAKTIRWCDALEGGWGANYNDGIIYLRGGDAISGEIHAELSETNDLGAVPAVRELMGLEREGIRQLQARFGRVHVISIPGNHGRTTIKPRHKGYTTTNYETLLSWWLESLFDNDPAVTFSCPESGYARFEIFGHRFEMRHGDRMGAGGGAGWIGAPAPITKGHKKIRLDAASVGAPVDYVLTGHLHTSMQLPHGWANGSMPGYNEFARSLGLEPDCAKQWLIMVPQGHLPYGIELHLSKQPVRK